MLDYEKLDVYRTALEFVISTMGGQTALEFVISTMGGQTALFLNSTGIGHGMWRPLRSAKRSKLYLP